MSAEFSSYAPSGALPYSPRAGEFDVYACAEGAAKDAVARLLGHMAHVGAEGLARLQRDAEVSLRNQGITFTVYADARGTEKILPFDVVPRVIAGAEWRQLEAGIAQRLQTVQLLLADLYGPQRVLRDRVLPSELVLTSPLFCREMVGIRPPGDVWVHVAGIDLIQDAAGTYRVLEDNLRVPSGVSYVLENRRVSSRIMPELLQRCGVRSVDHYAPLLLGALRSLAGRDDPTIGILTPGAFNSAYFEHSFLAAEMGVELVEGQDLLVDHDKLYMRTTAGLRRVDLLYRRVDDAFLDPLVFRPDSMLGVPGLVHALRAGNVAVSNMPGTGVVDDKALYAYFPELIRYFQGEDPILEQVPTFSGRKPAELSHIRDQLENLVLKPVDGAGGYGIVVGPAATAAELAEARAALEARPASFVAQPVQMLSTVPTLVPGEGDELALEPRHVDLRPFAVTGRDGHVNVLPGGLTRVALRRGSLIVNSSQGGGSKDTWVLSDVQG